MTPTNEAGYGLPELPEPDPDMQGKEYSAGCYERGYTADQMRQYARAALALSRGVPEGWKLVPVEPTEAMCGAIEYGAARPICETHQADRMYFLRKAIAAAPAAAGAQGEDWFGDVLASAGEVIPMQPATLSDAALIAGWEAKAASYDKLGPEEDGGDPTGDKAKTLRDCANELRSRIALQLAPQPAAADGGVRERAREILGLHASTNVAWVTTLQALEAVATALSSHRQAGEPDDVEKSVSVLRVLHQGSADDMAKAGREDLANVHYDAIRLLDYALDLHRQNVSMPNSGDSEYKPWAKAIDELAWVIGELEYIEGMKAIKSSEIPDYISRKAAWRESCEALMKEHGRALLAPPPGADLSKQVASVCLVTERRLPHFASIEVQLYDGYEPKIGDRLALVEKGAGNA